MYGDGSVTVLGSLYVLKATFVKIQMIFLSE
jgi:hypothetical protein